MAVNTTTEIPKLEKRIAELLADFRIQNATIADQHDTIAELESQLAEAEAEIKRLHKCIAREWVGK